MATEYISREAAIETLRRYKVDPFDAGFLDDTIFGFTDGIDTAISKLSVMPAADVVEAVRCKDCKFSWKTDESDLSDLEYKCIFHSVFVSEEWYCADGQRRQNRI